MADNIECEICGGTDFYKESGYFYCNECQTQSQEVRDHEFQEDITELTQKKTKKIKQPLPDKSDSKLTSWECYNIVMSSLTQQLVNLGAKKSLRSVVKYLWMRYLEKLEVIYLDFDEKPKLSLVNSKMDAHILYGRTVKKRRRKESTSDESSTTLYSASSKKERSKKKRALVQAHYEQFSQKASQESSLLNETLTSLKSSSERSVGDHPVRFNRYSVKELRKKISKRHLMKHKLDKEQNLKCHKLTHQNSSNTYKQGVHFMSPLRLYCVLYLGLLINRDKIQLGDLFRFIREGHLSFNSYTQLFPDNYSNKFLNIQNNNKNCMFTNRVFRTTAAKIATFLDVVRYIKVVDLTQLCQRFCKEMNLPDEVFTAVKNLISKTNPKCSYTRKSTIIPNYEGRALSFILFTLKLLFGLDGVTEFELSKYTQLINDLNINKPKMFDVIKWMEHIGYRNLIVRESHFPYSYMENSEEIDSDLFLQYVKSREIEVNKNIKLTKEMSDYQEVLMRIKELQDDVHIDHEFPSSLTPFLDYAKVLLKSAKRSHSNDVLKESFQESSLDFLLRPNKYLQLVGENVMLKHGGANDNWIIQDVKSYRHVKAVTDLNHNLIPVHVLSSGCEKDIEEELSKNPKRARKTYDALYVQTKFQECRRHIFDENELYIKKVSSHVEFNEINPESRRSQTYNIHYNPYERYWLYLQMNIDHLSKSECEQFFNNYTNTFKLIFKECTRIAEQSEQELLEEFQFSELFLVFAATYGKKADKTKSKELLHENLGYYVGQAETYW